MTGKECFVISPIGESESPTRKRADQVFTHIIKPSVEKFGYIPTRADHISEPGMITSQIIQRIVDDPLVVADLTERNPNVFYELAIRHANRKPLIQLIEKDEIIPFDVAGSRIIQLDYRNLDSVAEAKSSIEAQIEILENNPRDLETPISVSLDLQTLRESDNPAQRSLADILAEMAEIRSNVSNIERKIDHVRNVVSPAGEARIIRPEYAEIGSTIIAGIIDDLSNIEKELLYISDEIGEDQDHGLRIAKTRDRLKSSLNKILDLRALILR